LPNEIIYPVLAVMAIAAVIAYLFFWNSGKKRSRNLRQISDSLNLSFSQSGDLSLLKGLDEFRVFSQGNDSKISNVLVGTIKEIPLKVFDYECDISQDEGTDLVTQTVIVFESDRLALPEFVLGPKGLLHNIRNNFSHKDINFESRPNFAKKYWVRGENEEDIRKIFNDKIIDYYERHSSLNTEGKGTRLICYRYKKLVPSNQIQDFIQEGCDIFDLFKAN
jgi:hypothetical protein